MLSSSIPARFQKVWAASAGGAFIRTVPVASQIGIQDGAASFTDGFVPDNFTPVAAGGVPPFGQDFNGLNNVMTAWDIWYQAGGAITYDATFSTAQGGYPAGAKVASALVLGKTWLSLVDSNTTDPDSSGATNWVQAGCLLTGVPFASFSTSPEPQCVLANALTIGNASSNGTARANADTWFLFAKLWALSASACPIFTSSGSASTRGANAVADFAANKAIATPNMKGLGVIGADTMGGAASTFLTGAPITFGNVTTTASLIGETTHAMQPAENGVHNHGTTDLGHIHGSSTPLVVLVGGPGGPNPGAGSSPQTATISSAVTGLTINSQGSGTGHNTVERNTIVYWNLPL